MFFVVVLFSPLVSSEELAIWLLVSFSPGAKDTFFAFDGLVSGVVIGCGLVVVWTYSCSASLIILRSLMMTLLLSTLLLLLLLGSLLPLS